MIRVSDTFTINTKPPRGGKYIVFCPSEPNGPASPYDRVQFFGFDYPPFGFESDPMFDADMGTWTLAHSHIVDVFMDHREDLPVFTVVEQRGKFSRLRQVGGVRQVSVMCEVWFSSQLIESAIDYGTLVKLS